ncbi:hypothetical protein AB1Y20_001041 [Prymnesium parvum]
MAPRVAKLPTTVLFNGTAGDSRKLDAAFRAPPCLARDLSPWIPLIGFCLSFPPSRRPRRLGPYVEHFSFFEHSGAIREAWGHPAISVADRPTDRLPRCRWSSVDAFDAAAFSPTDVVVIPASSEVGVLDIGYCACGIRQLTSPPH